MKMWIMNFMGKKTDVDIGNIEDIHEIKMSVISGDEILVVIKKNGLKRIFDSAKIFKQPRYDNLYDDDYTVYSVNEAVNLLTEKQFLERKDVEWRWKYIRDKKAPRMARKRA